MTKTDHGWQPTGRRIQSNIKDGVYELFYRCQNQPPHAGSDSLLLVMRQGQLLGADRWGGLISGRCRFDEPSGRHHFEVIFDGPPDGVLVTGAAPPATTRSIELVTDVAGWDKATGTVDLFGESVSLELQYCGPLPLPTERRQRASRRTTAVPAIA